MDRVSSRDNAASIAKPGAAGATPLVQKSDFKGMDFAAGEAALKPREGAHGKPALPVIDTWRVAAGGEAVVSGNAEPGSTIEVMVDGTAVASAAATTG